jgi:hypothetical protein
MARVVRADPGTGRGALSIAGAVLEAELPKQVRAGQDIRLVVREVSAERVVLSMSDDAAIAPPPPPVPLPGGGTVRVTERDATGQGGSQGEGHTVALRYDAPTLGAVDLRLQLDAGSLRVTATLAQGEPVTLAQAESDGLRQTLAGSTDRAVTVTVEARHEPLEVYA